VHINVKLRSFRVKFLAVVKVKNITYSEFVCVCVSVDLVIQQTM